MKRIDTFSKPGRRTSLLLSRVLSQVVFLIACCLVAGSGFSPSIHNRTWFMRSGRRRAAFLWSYLGGGLSLPFLLFFVSTGPLTLSTLDT